MSKGRGRGRGRRWGGTFRLSYVIGRPRRRRGQQWKSRDWNVWILNGKGI